MPSTRWMLAWKGSRKWREEEEYSIGFSLKPRFWHCLDIGFYEVTEPDERKRERERAGKG